MKTEGRKFNKGYEVLPVGIMLKDQYNWLKNERGHHSQKMGSDYTLEF